MATAKGNAGRFVYFAYPAGAMMPARTAPAKRMQFFVASHAPPPVNDQILNADGLKLLGGAIDWLARQTSTARMRVGIFGASTGGGAALGAG